MSIWQIVYLVFFGACWVYSLYSIGQSKRIIAEFERAEFERTSVEGKRILALLNDEG